MKLMTVLAATALAVVGFAPAASATCTPDPTGNVRCLEQVLCAPLAVLSDLGFDANCVA